MPIKNEGEAFAILDRLKKDFFDRDRKWEARRNIRYRRMENILKQLPLNSRVSDKALMVHQSEIPNQEAHKRTKRLVSNPAMFEVVLLSGDPTTQNLGQSLEDGIKALYRWMNRGRTSFEWKSTQHQQGDGLGIGKIDFVPGHGTSLKDFSVDDLARDSEEEDSSILNTAREKFRELIGKNKSASVVYSEITDDALKAELPPYRISSVDPLAFYFWEDDDGITVGAEVGEKSLNPLLEAFESYGLKLVNNRLVVTPGGSGVASATTSPSDYHTGSSHTHTGINLAETVQYAELRTRDQIVILIEHPRVKSEMPDKSNRGVMITFDNPFGPYTTGYALIPGDVTTESDPADMFQPPILGSLSTAQIQNVIRTAQISAGLEKALAPSYMEVQDEAQVPPSDENKTKEATTNKEIPVVAGKIRKVETPNVDLDTADARMQAEANEYRLQEELTGEASSEASGHRLSIQVSQADLQMVPYQSARAKAIAELMKGIIYSIRKHGLPVFIPTLPDSRRRESGVQVQEPASITPQMANLPFELIVRLGADTPSTKYARWAALKDQEEDGIIGYQTRVEQSDVENPVSEIARVFEGKLLKATMEQVLPKIAETAVAFATKRFDQLTATEPTGAEELPGEDPASGLVDGGGAQTPGLGDLVDLPGVGQPVLPTQIVDGQRVQEGAGEQQVTS